MFATHETARLPNLLASKGVNQWSFVAVMLNHYWLHITYVVDHGEDGRFTETLMSSSISQLLELTEQANLEVIFVDLVSPDYMNGTERWKMEALREIWLCSSDKFPKQKVYVFQLESGVRYEDIRPTATTDYHENELIFSLNARQ